MIYAGTIIEINNNKSYVFTMDYSVITIKTREDYILGQHITFTQKDIFKDTYYFRFKSIKNLAVVAAALLLITIIALVTLVHPFNTDSSSFDQVCTALVSVDINPSIQISINKEKQIVKANAVNKDGVNVLKTVDLKNLSLPDGIKKIVSTAKELGYIDKDTNVVLVSAALYNSLSDSDSKKYANQLKDILSNIEASQNEASVLTLFIDDSSIIQRAKSNNLSIGKELLYQYAQSENGQLSADDIRNLNITELLLKLNALKQDGKLNEKLSRIHPLNNPSDSLVLTEPPSPTETTSPTQPTNPTKAPASTDEPTITTKPKPTQIIHNGEFKPYLSVKNNNNKLNFFWFSPKSNKIIYKGNTYQGFQYYKIVASETNPNPQYPEDGYLTCITDRNTTKYTINPCDTNSCSPKLIPGKSYYFCITYVFENGKFSSASSRVKIPSVPTQAPCKPTPCTPAPCTPAPCKPQPSEEDSNYNLSVSSSCSGLDFKWTPVKDCNTYYNGKTYTDFNYYKIVASKTNHNPKYPEDGYLAFFSEKCKSCWTLSLSNGDYNHNPELISGETYYFSITYVFENGSFTSNSVPYKVP